jgi:hypothetical protein
MSTENKEFFDLLNSIVDEQTFSLNLCPRKQSEVVSCKKLSTAQLKDLIKSVVDSPLTQASFNSTATKVFEASLVEQSKVELNVIDRLLFILETRIQSLSPVVTLNKEDKKITVDLEDVKNKLNIRLKADSDSLGSQTVAEGKIALTFGVAKLSTEAQLNEELYKNINFDIKDADELRKIIGEAFINEIAKALETITIEDKTLDLSTVTFKSRLKTVENLPASLIQKVIEYIENYKKIIDECLTVDGYSIPIDGSLFSLR